MKINIFGVNINIIDSAKILENILYISKADRKEVIANVNINALNIAYKNADMRSFLNSAYINFIDGDGVNIGAKILGLQTGPKVTYDWWIWKVAEVSEINNLSWYILGAKETTLKKAVENLKLSFPKLNIVGYHDGYFHKNDSENNLIINEINSLKPNVLLLAMGMPMQEEWLHKNIHLLKFNVALTGGAVVDYLSGEFKSTPKIFRDLKIEWFYRFLQKPNYLFKRYFLGNPLFIYRIFLEKLSYKY